MEEKYYTIHELADLLKVNQRTIVTLIKDGRLMALNVGTKKRAHWRIYEGHYLAFLADSYEKHTGEQ
jgi:excisionase family DNA binding protein